MSERRKHLVIYLMAGRETPELAAAAVAGGADIVEIGFPFSDPLADGPVIRRAGEKALAAGMRTRRCLDCLAEISTRVEVPLVPMTYSSILEAYGWERFAADETDGWLYLVTLTGTTGSRTDLSALAGIVERARRATDKPLYAGFGISTPDHARAAAAVADGIAVGSRAVEVAEEGAAALERYVGSLRTALDAG